MTQRLIQALQRGGVAAPLARDQWGVWRGTDRRRRQIGTLAGRDVELLRLQGSLAPLGDFDPPILVWSGAIEPSAPSTGGVRVLKASAVFEDRPLIEQVVSNCSDLTTRSSYRTFIQAYRADEACLARGEQVPGMNWTGLALGGRIQGGRPKDDYRGSADIAGAKRRFDGIARLLPEDELRFLNSLVLANLTKSKLAKQFQIRSSLLERRAIAVLRTVTQASIYVLKET